jgi:hypothetical protein
MLNTSEKVTQLGKGRRSKLQESVFSKRVKRPTASIMLIFASAEQTLILAVDQLGFAKF